MHYLVSVVVDMVEDNTAAAIAVVEVASVEDTGAEVVRLVATVEMTPRTYFVVANIADLCLVAVASLIPLSTLHNTLSIQCVYI
jgi:hypothetical protein